MIKETEWVKHDLRSVWTWWLDDEAHEYFTIRKSQSNLLWKIVKNINESRLIGIAEIFTWRRM